MAAQFPSAEMVDLSLASSLIYLVFTVLGANYIIRHNMICRDTPKMMYVAAQSKSSNLNNFDPSYGRQSTVCFWIQVEGEEYTHITGARLSETA